MLKAELAELLSTGDQTVKLWMRSTKRELELVLEIRTGSPEQAAAARAELDKIENRRHRAATLRREGIIRR